MPRANHNWTFTRLLRRPGVTQCRNCGTLRWQIHYHYGGGVCLYGRDGINWSTARPECAPPARGIGALIPEAAA